MSIVRRCIEWNKARYEQVYDDKLAMALLQEELGELMQARTKVEALDAIGDIVFVAIGVLWKLGMSEQYLVTIFEDYNLAYADDVVLADLHHGILSQLDLTVTTQRSTLLHGPYMAAFAMFAIVLPALDALKLRHEFYRIVTAICTSNETKEVKGKVDPSVKANIDKGIGFVHPKTALCAILESNGA